MSSTTSRAPKRLYYGDRRKFADSTNESDEFSPRRTRSGRVYDKNIGGRNNDEAVDNNNKKIIRAPKPVFNEVTTPEFGGFLDSVSTPHCSPKKRLVDIDDDDEEDIDEASRLNPLRGATPPQHPVLLIPSDDEEDRRTTSRNPPKLNYCRRAVSRIGSGAVTPMTPRGESPPTHGVMLLRIFDASSPRSNLSSSTLSAGNHPISSGVKSFLAERRNKMSKSEPRRPLLTTTERKSNVNPFTPEALFISAKKRSRQQLHRMDISSPGGSFSELQKSLDQMSDISDDNDTSLYDVQPPSAKRLRVSDIHISRYNKEFVELQVLASGEYGCVKVARHCLDGKVYAIKVTKKVIKPNSHEEHVAMYEVFAHAALMKHKHVVQYFNSWVENCQVYIQTEFCEGGSLQAQINAYRKKNRRFSESELRNIMIQVAKGLQYIHSKDLAHMDIKPENIFIALEHPNSPSTSPGGTAMVDAGGTARNSGNESTDSGNHSGNDAAHVRDRNALSSSPFLRGNERLTYKIGDLGNIAHIHGEEIPEEGDCRYMAPELLAANVDRSKLPKADVFSLGLTVYAAASLTDLPKNSMDGSVLYERIKRGDLPYMEMYSKEFNQLLRSVVAPDPAARPTPNKLMTMFQSSSNYAVKSRSQLCKELKDCESRIRELEELLEKRQYPAQQNLQVTPVTSSSKVTSSTPNIKASLLSKTPSSSRAIGKGTNRSSSCIL